MHGSYTNLEGQSIREIRYQPRDMGIESDFVNDEVALWSNGPLHPDVFCRLAGDLKFNDDMDIAQAKIETPEENLSFYKRHQAAIEIGAGVTAITSLLVASPLDETLHDLKEVAPIIIPSLIVSEAAFIGGAAMMVSAVGMKIPKNPLKLRKTYKEVLKKASDSTMYWEGFWTNTVGAIATAVVPAATIMAKLPTEKWGSLAYPAIDLVATYLIRRNTLPGRTKSHERSWRQKLVPRNS